MSDTYKGTSFPFRFGSGGGVAKSELTHFDYSRIRESLRQIVFTFKKERIMNLDFGNKRDFIFENLEDLTSRNLLAHEISKLIEKEESRVSVNNVNVYPHEEEGKIVVDINVHIIKFVKDTQVQVDLDVPEELTGGVIDIG